MKPLSAVLLAIATLGGSAAGSAESAIPVLDVARVPFVLAPGRAAYGDFLLANLPRAMAVASNGRYGWYGGDGTIEGARAKAMKSCAD